MENQEIKAGDVVILKSEEGKSSQTVMTVGKDGALEIECYWFLNGELKREFLSRDVLLKIK